MVLHKDFSKLLPLYYILIRPQLCPLTCQYTIGTHLVHSSLIDNKQFLFQDSFRSQNSVVCVCVVIDTKSSLAKHAKKKDSSFLVLLALLLLVTNSNILYSIAPNEQTTKEMHCNFRTKLQPTVALYILRIDKHKHFHMNTPIRFLCMQSFFLVCVIYFLFIRHAKLKMIYSYEIP